MKAELHIVTVAEHESGLPDGAIVLGGDATHVAYALPSKPGTPKKSEKGDE